VAEYVALEELKRSLELAGESYADEDLSLAITAASQAVESLCNRRFYLDEEDATHEYPAERQTWIEFDDVAAVSGVSVDTYGNGTFIELTDGEDYALLPRNRPSGDPATGLELSYRSAVYGLQNGQECFGSRPSIVRITGRFGWGEIPAPIKLATKILATRLLKRVREAPFGVAGMGADGIAVRIASGDPDVAMLTAPYGRRRRLA